MSRHDLRRAAESIAKLRNYPARSLPEIRVGNRHPALAAYRRLVAELTTNAPADGYTDPRQLPPLTNEQRATILRATPDLVNEFELDPEELAQIFEGSVDARLWLAACVEGAVRKWLFQDVCEELARDAAVLDESARDPELCREDLL